MYKIKESCKFGLKGEVISAKDFNSIPLKDRKFFEVMPLQEFLSAVKVENDLIRKITSIPYGIN